MTTITTKAHFLEAELVEGGRNAYEDAKLTMRQLYALLQTVYGSDVNIPQIMVSALAATCHDTENDTLLVLLEEICQQDGRDMVAQLNDRPLQVVINFESM